MNVKQQFMAALIGVASWTGQAYAADQAADGDYTVTMNVDLWDGGPGQVYVQRDPMKVKFLPDGTAQWDIIPVIYRTYTLAAENNAGETVVCTGLKIELPEDSDLAFFTRHPVTADALRPSLDNETDRHEKSYGTCTKTNLSAGYEFVNARVTVLTHGLPQSAMVVPVLVGPDGAADEYQLNAHGPHTLLDGSGRACAAAGWNEEYYKAVEGQKIKVDFCP